MVPGVVHVLVGVEAGLVNKLGLFLLLVLDLDHKEGSGYHDNRPRYRPIGEKVRYDFAQIPL
jgi:hypothetical protein